MSFDTTPQRLAAAPASVPGLAELELDEIQGDVLIGLQKNYERFVFFNIARVGDFKSLLRKKITNRITTTSTVHAREHQLRDYKTSGGKDPLPLVGLNLALTNTGIEKLVPGVNLGDPSFAQGAAQSAANLGDSVNAAKVPTGWKPAFVSKDIDGVFLVTGGTKAAVDGEANLILGILGAAVVVVFDQTGHVRPDLEKGHEHFGWQDGISQPGVKGISVPFPGQRVLDPGHFVFGYPGQPGVPPVTWMKNGSLMVFRRLNQLVPEFSKFILDSGAAVGVDPVLLGARLVGRWKSGAPLALTPAQDDIALGGNAQQNNHFDFSDDQAQRRCPFVAHIRKTNPRADFDMPGFSQEKNVDPRRIIRQGIPFGPEVTPAEQAANATTEERGLMFVCYQTSIVSQFEFIQISWVNNANFVFGKVHADGSAVEPGPDPIINQNNLAGENSIDEVVPNYPSGSVIKRLTLPQHFVVPTGGAYFFVPSISALQNELTS